MKIGLRRGHGVPFLLTPVSQRWGVPFRRARFRSVARVTVHDNRQTEPLPSVRANAQTILGSVLSQVDVVGVRLQTGGSNQRAPVHT